MIGKFISEAQVKFPNFTIDQNQEEFYRNLIMYFQKSDKSVWDLNKGLLINGEVGCGKTMTMDICREIFKGFRIIEARHILRDYLTTGADVINIYGRYDYKTDGKGNRQHDKPRTLCIDDLGLEEVDQKFYGNKSNVIAELLLDRYREFVKSGMITHATTNIGASQIEQLYGIRGRDRMKEMFNLVTLPGESKRK